MGQSLPTAGQTIQSFGIKFSETPQKGTSKNRGQLLFSKKMTKKLTHINQTPPSVT
jgi:hypothetical protein